MELFSYNIPTILFYTLPITIFISISLTLSKLSSEYELIVLTSFGQNPLKILKIFFPFLISVTALLLLISVFLVPKADFMQIKFKANKQVEAQFNIQPSEYGQEFANWLIYVNEKQNDIYEDIVLFRQEPNGKVYFILANTADVHNISGSINLNLQKGKLFEIDQELRQVDFEKMVLHNELQQMSALNNLNDLIQYWTIEKDKLVFYILGSLFPLLSVFYSLYAGYYNPRYEKNRSVLITTVTTVVFIVLSQNLSKEFELQVLIYFPVAWLVLGYILYHKNIKQAY
jgi:lipopolysaccharide export system permease protein